MKNLLTIAALLGILAPAIAFASVTLSTDTISGSGALNINPTGLPVTVNGDLTVTGTCTGCGGGGGGSIGGSIANTQIAFGTGVNTIGGSANLLQLPSLSTPTSPVLTTVGTAGSATYGYQLVANNPVGDSLPSVESTIATGNATLTGSNYINIATVAATGVVSYDVYRTTAGGTPNSTGWLGKVAAGVAFHDTGLEAGTVSSPPPTFANTSLGSYATRLAVGGSLTTLDAYTQAWLAAGDAQFRSIMIDPPSNGGNAAAVLGVSAYTSASTPFANFFTQAGVYGVTFLSGGAGDSHIYRGGDFDFIVTDALDHRAQGTEGAGITAYAENYNGGTLSTLSGIKILGVGSNTGQTDNTYGLNIDSVDPGAVETAGVRIASLGGGAYAIKTGADPSLFGGAVTATNFETSSLGSHLKTSGANNDIDGTIALSSATSASHTFATAFNSAPVCTLTPTSDPNATGRWWVTTSTSAVTANVSSSGTITFNYHCVGNPN